jgi:hypothetical protein
MPLDAYLRANANVAFLSAGIGGGYSEGFFTTAEADTAVDRARQNWGSHQLTSPGSAHAGQG